MHWPLYSPGSFLNKDKNYFKVTVDLAIFFLFLPRFSVVSVPGRNTYFRELHCWSGGHKKTTFLSGLVWNCMSQYKMLIWLLSLDWVNGCNSYAYSPSLEGLEKKTRKKELNQLSQLSLKFCIIDISESCLLLFIRSYLLFFLHVSVSPYLFLTVLLESLCFSLGLFRISQEN